MHRVSGWVVGGKVGILAAGGPVFGTLGMPELIFIFVVALLLFGPRKMPQIGRSIGRAMGEFRRASNEFKRTIEDEVAMEEIRHVQRDIKGAASEATETVDAAVHEAGSSGDERGPEPPKQDDDAPAEGQ